MGVSPIERTIAKHDELGVSVSAKSAFVSDRRPMIRHRRLYCGTP